MKPAHTFSLIFSLLFIINPCYSATLPLAIRRELTWGQVNILHTTDIHGWLAGHARDKRYSGDLGDFASFVQHMKHLAKQKDVDLLLVDTGDLHDGTGLSDLTDPPGSWTDSLLANMDYDILVAGNHELYLSTVANDTYHNFIPLWEGRYLAANIDIYDEHVSSFVPFGDRYAIFSTPHNVKILAFGFVNSFSGATDTVRVLPVSQFSLQPWWNDMVSNKDIGLILIPAHVPVHNASELDIVLSELRIHFPTTPIQVLGGHSHIRDYAIYDEKAVGIESGRYCETVGWVSINGIPSFKSLVKLSGISSLMGVESYLAERLRFIGESIRRSSQQIFSSLQSAKSASVSFSRSYIDWNPEGFMFHSKTKKSSFNTSLGEFISNGIYEARKALGLLTPIGCSPKKFAFSEVPFNDSNSIYHLFQSELFPKIVVNESRHHIPHYIIVNSGGIRGGLNSGAFGLDEVFQVCPFKSNIFYVLKDVAWSITKYLPQALQHSGYLIAEDTLQINTPQVSDAKFEDFYEHSIRKTYGYTTHDDLGDDGDDTAHLTTPHYEPLRYICSQVGFDDSFSGDDKQVVDVVAPSFVIPRLDDILNKIADKPLYSPDDWELYFTRPDGKHSMTDLLPLYADLYWDHDCLYK